MDQITNIGFLRLKEVLKIIPVSKSNWWAGVKSGKYPQSIKIGARTTVWLKQDIINFIEKNTHTQEEK